MNPQRRELHFKSLSPHGFHRVVYDEWGDPANMRVAICVHGVGRNAHDFDDLAAALAGTHRVLSIDMPGRGRSAWLADPGDYVFATYLTALTALIARSGAETVDWVGTSMGGLLGIVMAAQPQTPVAKLVVNDIKSPSSPPRSSASAGTSASIRRSRPTTKSRATSAPCPPRSARSPMRNGSSSRFPMSGNERTADGDSLTIRASPFFAQRLRRRTSGRCGMPFVARHSFCAAANPICYRPKRRRGWQAVAHGRP